MHTASHACRDSRRRHGTHTTELSETNRELQRRCAQPRIAASYALVGAILLFGGVGYALDRWLGSSPWVLLAGLLVGLGIGFANLALSLRR